MNLPCRQTRRSVPEKSFRRRREPRGCGSSRIYRWNPDDGENPRLDVFAIDLNQCGAMVLDALIKIKNETDPTLTFRRSCREGICGSCAMNIDGRNGSPASADRGDQGDVAIYPLPHMPVIKDLVAGPDAISTPSTVDQPWLQTDTAAAGREQRQSLRRGREARRVVGMHPVLLLLHRLPELLVEWRSLSGPRCCCRPIAGSPTAATRPRANGSTRCEDPFRLYRCHTIMNCTRTCPKGLNPAKAIAEIKKLMVLRR